MSDIQSELWRLAEEVSVIDAAVLIAGGDPAAIHSLNPNPEIESVNHPEGFQAAFRSICAAVNKRTLPARLAYPSYSAASSHPSGPNSLVIVESGAIAYSLSSDFILPSGEGFADEWSKKLVVERTPDWSKSFIDVSDLKAWLRSRGFNVGFFFAKEEPEDDDFMDPDHDHFSPELALAVKAWRALASEQKFKKGAKAAIEAWLTANPDAWEGDGKLSVNAKDRVITLVNWRRGGGAPASEG
jgi:hypothetical protein